MRGPIPASGRRRLPRAVRERQMLEAAVVVFAQAGFASAAMDEIAHRAGISKPMLYAYLGAKEELFLACMRDQGTRLLEALIGAVQPDLPADEQLWRGLRAFFEYVAGHREGWIVLYRQARAHQPFAAELERTRAGLVEAVAGLLRGRVAARHRGASEAELVGFAYALVGACESLGDWLADRPAEPADPTALRLMNFLWLGAEQLLAGAAWPLDQPAPTTAGP